MANEAVIIELNPNRNAENFTVADGTGISKGCLLKVADAHTASAAAGKQEAVAGIAAAEKEANDGATTLGVYVPGSGHIFDLYADDNITTGQAVHISGANKIGAGVNNDFRSGAYLGRALEDATQGETIRVRV